MKNLALLLFLLIFTRVFAQEHVVFSPINSINGLSDNRVRSICQLADGRMVVITEGLATIYDGPNFKYIPHNELQSYRHKAYSGFHRAYVDNDNKLWLKNQHRLMLFDIGTE